MEKSSTPFQGVPPSSQTVSDVLLAACQAESLTYEKSRQSFDWRLRMFKPIGDSLRYRRTVGFW